MAFVQFTHHGKEQDAVPSGVCPWNRGNRRVGMSHRRKFLVCEGRYVRDGSEGKGEVGFWGEWEPPSIVRQTRRAAGEPCFFHTPAFYEPKRYEGLLDTDPFVFGGRFLYTGCRQHTAHNAPGGARETVLKKLGRGSIILFGSCVSKKFVIDTVFVVAGYVEYPNGNFDKLSGLGLPKEYYATTLIPSSAANPSVSSFKLYVGATMENRVRGMFSYSPCMTTRTAPRGFPRVNVELHKLITQNLSQGAKTTPMVPGELEVTWQAVKEQVEDAGCALAHEMELDPVRLDVNA